MPLRTFCYNIKNGTDSASAHFDVSSRKNTLYTLLFLVTHCLIHVCMCLFCPPQFRFQSLPAPRHIPAGSDRLRLEMDDCKPLTLRAASGGGIGDFECGDFNLDFNHSHTGKLTWIGKHDASNPRDAGRVVCWTRFCEGDGCECCSETFEIGDVAEVDVTLEGSGVDGYLVASVGEHVEILHVEPGWFYGRIAARLDLDDSREGWLAASAVRSCPADSVAAASEASPLQLGAIDSPTQELRPADARHLRACAGDSLESLHTGGITGAAPKTPKPERHVPCLEPEPPAAQPSLLMPECCIPSADAFARFIEWTNERFTLVHLGDAELTHKTQWGEVSIWVAVQYRAITIENVKYTIPSTLDLHTTLGYWPKRAESQTLWPRQLDRAKKTLTFQDSSTQPKTFDFLIKPNLEVCASGKSIYDFSWQSTGGQQLTRMSQLLNACGAVQLEKPPRSMSGRGGTVFHLSAYDKPANSWVRSVPPY